MLVDFTEKWIGDAMGAEAKKDFKERISKIYDKNFSYRLLINLRNYCHHGYMPVRIDYDGKCYFDLDQILNTPFFDIKDSFAEEIKKIKQEIHDKFQDDWTRIIYTRTLAEFQLCVITVYLDFITTIKPHLQKLRHNFDEILAHNPKDMGLIRDEATEIIVYHSPKDKAIYISPGTKTMKMIDDIEKTVKDRNKSAKKEFERAFKNAKFIASPNPPLS